MPDKLVATGDPDADAYLRIARKMHGLGTVLTEATKHIDAGERDAYVIWWPAVTAAAVGYGRAAQVAARAPRLMGQLRRDADKHLDAARARTPWAAELVTTYEPIDGLGE